MFTKRDGLYFRFPAPCPPPLREVSGPPTVFKKIGSFQPEQGNNGYFGPLQYFRSYGYSTFGVVLGERFHFFSAKSQEIIYTLWNSPEIAVFLCYGRQAVYQLQEGNTPQINSAGGDRGYPCYPPSVTTGISLHNSCTHTTVWISQTSIHVER